MFNIKQPNDTSFVYTNSQNYTDSMNDSQVFLSTPSINRSVTVNEEIAKLCDMVAAKHYFKPFAFNKGCLWYLYIKDKMNLFWNDFRNNYYGGLISENSPQR